MMDVLRKFISPLSSWHAYIRWNPLDRPSLGWLSQVDGIRVNAQDQAFREKDCCDSLQSTPGIRESVKITIDWHTDTVFEKRMASDIAMISGLVGELIVLRCADQSLLNFDTVKLSAFKPRPHKPYVGVGVLIVV